MGGNYLAKCHLYTLSVQWHTVTNTAMVYKNWQYPTSLLERAWLLLPFLPHCLSPFFPFYLAASLLLPSRSPSFPQSIFPSLPVSLSPSLHPSSWVDIFSCALHCYASIMTTECAYTGAVDILSTQSIALKDYTSVAVLAQMLLPVRTVNIIIVFGNALYHGNTNLLIWWDNTNVTCKHICRWFFQ